MVLCALTCKGKKSPLFIQRLLLGNVPLGHQGVARAGPLGFDAAFGMHLRKQLARTIKKHILSMKLSI